MTFHAALRLHTQSGRPLAHDSFLSKLEATLDRRLRPLTRRSAQETEIRDAEKAQIGWWPLFYYFKDMVLRPLSVAWENRTEFDP